MDINEKNQLHGYLQQARRENKTYWLRAYSGASLRDFEILQNLTPAQLERAVDNYPSTFLQMQPLLHKMTLKEFKQALNLALSKPLPKAEEASPSSVSEGKQDWDKNAEPTERVRSWVEYCGNKGALEDMVSVDMEQLNHLYRSLKAAQQTYPDDVFLKKAREFYDHLPEFCDGLGLDEQDAGKVLVHCDTMRMIGINLDVARRKAGYDGKDESVIEAAQVAYKELNIPEPVRSLG